MISIKLTNSPKRVLVDTKDSKLVNQYHWRLSNMGYAVAGSGSSFSMHRLIANTPQEMHTDHINRNKLDNRRVNLRVCTHTDNMRNRRVQGGVYFNKTRKRWEARIQLHGHRKFLGYFHFKADALAALTPSRIN